MDPKSDEGIFLGYSTNNRAYKMFNSRTNTMMESINVVIDDSTSDVVKIVETDVDTSVYQTDNNTSVGSTEINTERTDFETTNSQANKGPYIRIQKNHPKDLIIGNPDQLVTTRRSKDVISKSCFVSKFEPKNVKKALTDEFWIGALQEELNQFKRSEVWDLVPRPEGINVIGTKWVYKNKSDENGIVTRNKVRLVAQGYKQMLKEYNVDQDVMTLYCDNLSDINISKNPIQHSRTKHIDIRHH
ncbi:gag-pol polyprotein, partial [Trifolium medium]|nr:gag-pol polyprotein [Trifolium medium]